MHCLPVNVQSQTSPNQPHEHPETKPFERYFAADQASPLVEVIWPVQKRRSNISCGRMDACIIESRTMMRHDPSIVPKA